MINELIQKELEEIEEMVAEATEHEEYKEKVFYVREGMVRLTGNFVKAALLSCLIGWTEHYYKSDNEIYKKIREAAEMKDLRKIRWLKEQLRQGWFYKTYEDMAKEMLNTISKSTAERYCKEFEEKGYIWSRDPEEKSTYRARWYKANIDLIREELDKLGFDLDYFKKKREAEIATSQNGKSEKSTFSGDEKPKIPSNRISQNGKPSHQNGKSSPQNGKHHSYTTTTNPSTTSQSNSRYVGSTDPTTVLDKFSQYYKLTRYAQQKLTEFVEIYGDLLVHEALDRTIFAEKEDRQIAYIRGILKQWAEAGVKTKEDIEEHERKFREEQRRKKQRKKKRSGNKEDKLPYAIQLQIEREKAEKEQQQPVPQGEETENDEEQQDLQQWYQQSLQAMRANLSKKDEKKNESLAEKRARIDQKLKLMRRSQKEKQKLPWMDNVDQGEEWSM